MAIISTPSSDPAVARSGPLALAAAPVKSARQTSVELLGNLTMREIRSQYKRTALGRLWSFINPVATIAIFSVIFGLVLGGSHHPTANGTDVFSLWLAAALIPWNFISGGVMSGMNALMGNAGLLGKVYFPRYILIVSTIGALLWTFATEIGIVVLIMAVFNGPRVFLFIPLVIVLMLVTAAFCVGIGLMMSIAVVYFRDTQHFVSIFMQIWFYLSAIIFPFDLVRNLQTNKHLHFPLSFLWGLNPAYRFTNVYRSLLYYYGAGRWQDWVCCLVAAGVMLAVGILVFRRFSARVVEEL